MARRYNGIKAKGYKPPEHEKLTAQGAVTEILNPNFRKGSYPPNLTVRRHDTKNDQLKSETLELQLAPPAPLTNDKNPEGTLQPPLRSILKSSSALRVS